MDVVHLKLETEIPALRCVFNEGEELNFSYTSPSSVVVSFKQREPYDRTRPAGTGNGVCSAVTTLHIEPIIRSNIHDAIDNERIRIDKIKRENLQLLDDVFIHLRNVSRSTATIFNWVNGLDGPPDPLGGAQALYSEDGECWLRFSLASGQNETDDPDSASAIARLLRRSTPRKDKDLRGHCERSEAISVTCARRYQASNSYH